MLLSILTDVWNDLNLFAPVVKWTVNDTEKCFNNIK